MHIAVDDEFLPQHKIAERRLVAPDDFLDTVFWGRTDPKTKLLLDHALQLDHLHQKSEK